MKQTSKRLWALALALVMVMGLMAPQALAAKTMSGNWGEDGSSVKWSYNEKKKELTFSGKGDMEHWGESGPYFLDDEDEMIVDWDSVKTVKIGAGITYVESQLFLELSNIVSITVDSGNKKYSSADGVLFNKKKTELIAFPGGKKGDYVIPSSVKELVDNDSGQCAAFESRHQVTSVEVPKSVKELGDGQFWNCSKLTSLTILNSKAKIADGVGYYEDEKQDYERVVNKKLVIYGYRGSTAEKYAKENGIKFQDVTKKTAKLTVSSLSSVKNAKGKKLTVKWKKNTSGKGYQVQYSTDKKFKKNVKTVKIGKAKTTSTTIKKLKKGKTYYVRIRTVSGKSTSDWSKVKSVKIKK